MPSNIKVLLSFAAIYLVWGSTFYGVHLALQSFPPFLLSTLRFLIAGSLLLIYCIIRKEQMPSLADIRKNAICGIIIFIGGVVSVVWSQQYISSSLASIIITTPFWFVLLDKRQWAYYFSSKWIITGLLTGLVGVILLVGFKKGTTGSDNEYMQLLSIIIMIMGSFLWVAGSLYLKYKPATNSAYVNACIQLLSAGLFCLCISWFRNEPQQLTVSNIHSSSIWATLYLGIVSTMITFMAYIYLIKVKPPAIVSTYSYVNPLVAVLLGYSLAGEKITTVQIVALVIILCGVLFVNIPKYTSKA